MDFCWISLYFPLSPQWKRKNEILYLLKIYFSGRAIKYNFLGMLAVIENWLCEISPVALSQQVHLDKPLLC